MHGRIAPAAPAEDNLPPISWCDPMFEPTQCGPSPAKFMISAFLTILCGGALLLAGLATIGAHP